jgi:hypothetical protein
MPALLEKTDDLIQTLQDRDYEGASSDEVLHLVREVHYLRAIVEAEQKRDPGHSVLLVHANWSALPEGNAIRVVAPGAFEGEMLANAVTSAWTMLLGIVDPDPEAAPPSLDAARPHDR